MYDFNLSAGDTIRSGTDDVGQPLFFVVSEVDTVILDDNILRKRWYTGYWYKRYNAEEAEFFPTDVVWVEGIGDLTHGLLAQPGFLN